MNSNVAAFAAPPAAPSAHIPPPEAALWGDNVILQWVRVDDIRAPVYQRMLSERNVKAIARDFNWTLFDTLSVAWRERDQQFYVMDGGHRLAAARQRGIAAVPCLIYVGTSETEEESLVREIELFRQKNKTQLKLSLAADFQAALFAHKPAETAIQRSVEGHGFFLNFGRQDKKGIRAFAALRALHRTGGVALLDAVLSTITRAWGTDSPDAVSAVALQGLADFHRAHIPGDITADQLVHKLKAKSPAEVSMAGKTFSGRSRLVSAVDGYYNALVEAVNYGSRRRIQALPGSSRIRSGSAPLSAEQVREIRRLLQAGQTQVSIAKQFGVPPGTVGGIARGENYPGVGEITGETEV